MRPVSYTHLYLAKRDAEWMGKVHEFLGLTVGVVLNDMKPEERRAAYGCDITYVTNNELGFDYLRDNMVIYKEQLVQRDLHLSLIHIYWIPLNWNWQKVQNLW